MQFKGTIGDTVPPASIAWASLPTVSGHEGFTYKVISDHSTAPICKVGDTIISDGST